MFARVITAEVGADGFDSAMRFVRQQVPRASRQPGFKGYYVLADANNGKCMAISLWETREEMEAVATQAGPSGIQDEDISAAVLTSLNLETYEVAIQV